MRCLVVFVVALLAFQGCSADLQDIASQLHQNMQNIVDKVQDLVEDVEQKVVTAAQLQVTRIKDIITNLVEEGKAAVQAAVADVKEKTEAVVQCAEAVPSQLEEVVSSTVEAAYHCVADPVQNAKNLIVTAANLAKTANSTLNGIAPSVTACMTKTLLEQVGCTVRVYTDALATLGSITVQVTEAAAEAQQLISDFQNGAVITCEVDLLQSAPAKVDAVVDTAVSCVQDAVSA